MSAATVAVRMMLRALADALDSAPECVVSVEVGCLPNPSGRLELRAIVHGRYVGELARGHVLHDNTDAPNDAACAELAAALVRDIRAALTERSCNRSA